MASSNGNGNGEVWTKSTPLHYVAQVMHKLEDGTYPTEATKCFCGVEPNDTVITERDRYTIPHRMVMCENCLLMRANPRMTKEAYEQFYNIEYRKIYDGFPYGEKAESCDFLFLRELTKGNEIRTYVETAADLKPKCVIDIGCNMGGSLVAFQEIGATVYGTEWTERGRQFAATKGITVVRDVDDLITQGVKADLVIMQDIIEHFMDLHEMEKIVKVINKNGYVFLYTPGFFAAPPHLHFQNAHTFQFIAATLEYVMNRMGFVAELLDEHIVSLWKYIGEVAYPEPLPAPTWRKYVMEHFQQLEKRSLPPIRTRSKFTEKESITNLAANLVRKLPDISSLKDKYSGPVVVVGGGPSVDGQVDKIKELVNNGAKLIVCDRMYPWCSKVGLKPDFVVALDASDDVVDGFTHLQAGVKHLIVATVKPPVLDALKDYEIYLWSGASGSYIDAQEHWSKNGYNHVMIINTGSSVVLGSIMVSLVLGFRNVHLFGLDLMVPNTENTYSKDVVGAGVDRSYFEIQIGDSEEPILTCTAFLAFVQQFFGLMETARRWGMIESIDVYGDSLINRMWEKPKWEKENGERLHVEPLESGYGIGGIGSSDREGI